MDHLINVALRRFALLVSAAACIAMPVWSLIDPGPFEWHIAQEAASEGGLEALGLLVLAWSGFALRPRWLGATVIAVASALYARRHGVDVSILVLVLYAEGIFALGWRLLPAVGVRRSLRRDAMLIAGVLGVVAWSLASWLLGWAGAETPAAFRWLAIATLGVALLLHDGPRLCVLAWHGAYRQTGWSRACVALIVAFFFVLFAKASVVLDYDSLWYGLRGESVLLGEGGLFASHGLVAVVHYYPKLYEVLLLPFAGLGSTSLLFGIGILSAVLVAATTMAVVGMLGVRGPLRIAAGALAMTLPAVANIAVSAKGDAFSAWLLLTGVYALLRLRRAGTPRWLWLGLSACGLSLLCRLSNLPYAAMLVVLLVLAGVAKGTWRVAFKEASAWLFAATVALAALVTLRTWAVAGVPLIAPNAIVELEQRAGLTLAYPIALLPGGEGLPTLPVLPGLWQFLFAPATLPHVLITWTGNVWAWLPLAALILGARVRPTARDWPLLAIGLLFFPVLFGYRHPVPGGDGNYFILPILVLLAWGMVRAASGRLSHGRSSRFLVGICLAFALVGAAISFVTGTWGPGTRPLDIGHTRGPNELALRGDREIARARLGGVAHFFEGMPRGTRVAGIPDASADIGVPAEWFLPVRYEPLDAFAWQQPALVRDGAAMADFLRRTRVAYVVLPVRPGKSPVSPIVRDALASLATDGLAREAFRDADYIVWALDVRATAIAPLAGGGEASIAYDAPALCTGDASQVATIAWHAQVPTISVYVRAPGGASASLFAESGSTGRVDTGPWVVRGAAFDLRAGRGGRLLGTLRAEPVCD